MHKNYINTPNWRSLAVLCQYRNVPDTAEQVVNGSVWERSREQGCTGTLGMKDDECVLPGRGAGTG